MSFFSQLIFCFQISGRTDKKDAGTNIQVFLSSN